MRLPHDWLDAALPPNVRIGARSWLYSAYAFAHCRSTVPDAVVIGEDSGVYAGSFFDLGAEARVRIGDFCTLVGAVIATNGTVEIDDYAFLAHEVVIADSDWARPAPASPGGTVRIGENAWIGMRAVLLAGATIGAEAIVGAGAVVRGDVPPGAVAVGNPARVV